MSKLSNLGRELKNFATAESVGSVFSDRLNGFCGFCRKTANNTFSGSGFYFDNFSAIGNRPNGLWNIVCIVSIDAYSLSLPGMPEGVVVVNSLASIYCTGQCSLMD